MAAQTDDYSRRPMSPDENATPAVDRRYALFDQYVSLSDEIEGETVRMRDLDERLHALRAHREELRNELLEFLGAPNPTPSKGLPF